MAARSLLLAGLLSCASRAAPLAPARSLESAADAGAPLPDESVPAASLPVATTLRDELGLMQTYDVWTVRETVIGWTIAHEAVTRRMICDPNQGPDGRYCSMGICEIARESECSPALSVYHLEQDDQASRQHFDLAKAERITQRLIASAGALSPAGPPLALHVEVARDSLRLQSGRGQYGWADHVVARFDPATQAVEDAHLAATATTADGECAVAVGYYSLITRKAGLAVRTLERIAERACNNEPP